MSAAEMVDDRSFSPGSGECPELRWVAPDQLRTSLQALRGSGPPGPAAGTTGLAPLPLRVGPTADGAYEVLDGFKRLARWRQLGLQRVPVLVEPARSAVEQQAALLAANRPPRTLTPMDEARVVWALRHEEHLGPATIAKACGRKRRWVMQRLTLAEQLAPALQARLDAGRLGVTLAHALCAWSAADQAALVDASDEHRLTGAEALALLGAYRVAESPAERRALLAAPVPVVRPARRSASPLGALATRLEARLDQVREALEALTDFQLPDEGLSPAEHRRLEAGHRAVLLQLFHTAQRLAQEQLGLTPREEDHDDDCAPESPSPAPAAAPDPDPASPAVTAYARADRGGVPAPSAEVRYPQDCPEARPGPQGGPRPPRQAGPPPVSGYTVAEADDRQQARPLPGPDPGEGAPAPHRHPHPARAPGPGLPGQPHHPGRLRADPASPAAAPEEGLAPLRDPPG